MLGVIAAFAARRLSVPVLVAFLGVGMLLGSEGVGGIEFDDPDLARTVGTIALVAILFEGGLTTEWRDIRPILATAAILSTAGVVVTAAIVAGGAYLLFDLSPLTALLLGAVVGSTDAAAVFATLRFTTLRRRLAALIEAESGANDPMAIALTLGLIAWIQEPAYGLADLLLLLVQQLGLGLVIGVALGAAAAHVFRRLPVELAPFAPVASLATAALSFGATQAVGGSGFLAVYVVGLWLGNTPSPLNRSITAFHEGVAFLGQVVLFVILGLLVFPSELVPVIGSGLALAAVLVFVARPLAVWACTPFQGLSAREKHVVGWAGLRGAVPIVLATFALSEGIAESDTIFNAVFFVVLVSTLLQGLTLEPLARRLGLASEATPFYQPPLEVGLVRSLGADILEFAADGSAPVVGARVRDLGLPRSALIAVIVRGDSAIPPRGSTVIEAGDRLYVIARGEGRSAVERVFETWRRGTTP